MEEDMNERNKNIQENFEKILPKLWDKARENEDKHKSEYIRTLQTKLLNEIKSKIPTHSYQMWFSTLTIIDIIDGLEVVFETKPIDDLEIVFGTNTTIGKDWLEVRYLSLIEESLKTVTNNHFKVSIVLRINENDEKKNEELHKIEQCLICNCKDLMSKNIEIPLEIPGIVSITVEGILCPNCGEKYFPETINELMRLFKRREIERQINPLHLQSEEYRKSSAKAARDDDDC